MTESIQLRVEDVQAERLARYGHLVGRPSGRPADIETPINRYWDDVAPWVVKDGNTILSYLEVYARPARLNTLEVHRRASQAWIPMDGSRGIMVVARSVPKTPDHPDLGSLYAFRFGPGVAVVLHPETWHHVVFPEGEQARYLMLLRGNTRYDDMTLVTLSRWVELI